MLSINHDAILPSQQVMLSSGPGAFKSVEGYRGNIIINKFISSKPDMIH
jgi:hypothetical protein